MRDILGSLVSRSLGLERSVAPRLASRFEEPAAAPAIVDETVAAVPAAPRAVSQQAPTGEHGVERHSVRERVDEPPVAVKMDRPTEPVTRPEVRIETREHQVRPSVEREILVERTETSRLEQQPQTPVPPARERKPEPVAAPEVHAPAPLELARQILPAVERPGQRPPSPGEQQITGRRSESAKAVESAQATPETVVEVTIGRLEIRANTERPPAKPQREPQRAMTIEEYLQRRRS